jgi:hypothetical protein
MLFHFGGRWIFKTFWDRIKAPRLPARSWVPEVSTAITGDMEERLRAYQGVSLGDAPDQEAVKICPLHGRFQQASYIRKPSPKLLRQCRHRPAAHSQQRFGKQFAQGTDLPPRPHLLQSMPGACYQGSPRLL